MTLDLTDDEKAALLRELDQIITDDRYPLSPRIVMLKAIPYVPPQLSFGC